MTLDALRNAHQVPVHSTLLELVCALGEVIDGEDRVAEIARELVNSGRVVLTGNFRGRRLN